jgi:hypothetical protein
MLVVIKGNDAVIVIVIIVIVAIECSVHS